MPITRFPPVELADEHGLLALGGDLSPDSLLLAYRSGIFPWPINEEYPLAWFSPDPRGILSLSNLHIPRSLKKNLKKHNYQVSFNRAFEVVILNCQRIKRKQQDSTWITDEVIQAYIEMHRQGYAYSCEIWQNEEIVGGLYGVCINQFSSGESMFHTKTDASKLALIATLRNLEENGVYWLDTQMITPVVASLGGTQIARSDFIKSLQFSRNFSILFPKRTCEWEEFL